MRPIIPTYRYDDAPAAIDFLVRAFGFEVVMDVRDGDRVDHAQLRRGDGMIMLGSVRDDELGDLVARHAPGGRHTSTAYVVVDDVGAHAEQARAAGADVLVEPVAQDYGGANYVVADPEGHVWSFGSYDPWVEVDDDHDAGQDVPGDGPASSAT